MFDVSKGFGYVSAIGGTWEPPPGMPVIFRVKEARRTNWEYSHESAKYWTLDYFFQTGVSVRVRDESQPPLRRDTVTAHLYPPMTKYWEHAEPGVGPIHSCWVIFQGGEHTGLAGKIDSQHGYARFRDPRHRLGDHMQALAREGQMYEAGGFWRVQAMFLRLIDMLESAQPKEAGVFDIVPEDRPPEMHPVVVGVISYLQKHLAEPITVADLARDQRVSVSVLAHRYRAVVGEGPIKTLLRMRIQFAKELLLQGETLKSIAEKAGFCDEYHLSKLFKQIQGESPREFRKAALVTAGAVA